MASLLAVGLLLSFQCHTSLCSTTCAPLITFKHLVSTANHLIEQALLLSDMEFTDLESFRNNIDEQKKACTKLDEKVEAFIAKTGTFSCLPKGWWDELSAQRAKVKASTDDIERKVLVQKIVFQIQNGSVKDAASQFNQFSLSDQESTLRNVISLAHASKAENLVRCIKFLWSILSCRHVAAGYETILDWLISSGKTDLPEILLLSGTGTNCQEDLTQISNKVKPLSGNATTRWVAGVESGDFSNITSFFKNYGADPTFASILNSHIPDVIHRAYQGQLGNFENVFQLIKHLPFFSNIAEGLSALYAEMKRSGHGISSETFRLIYDVKKKIAHGHTLPSHTTESMSTLGKLEILKNSFPKILRQVIWSEESDTGCLIRPEAYHHETLFPSGFNNYQIFTYDSRKQGSKTPHAQNFWKFQGIDGDAYSFHIINLFVNDIKYLAEDIHNKMNGSRVNTIFASKLVDQDDLMPGRRITWRIKPYSILSNGDKVAVRLRNDFGNNYLIPANDTSGNDRGYRKVLTLTKKIIPSASRWIISCD